MSFALHTYWLLCIFFVCHSVCLFFTWWSKSILAISAILSRPKHCSDLLSETILKLWVFMFQWDLQLLNHIPRLVNFVIFNNILFLFQNYDQINEWILLLKSRKFIIENSKNYLDYTVCTLMPYPCSHFYFDINFGDRLYSKEKRPGSPLLFWI